MGLRKSITSFFIEDNGIVPNQMFEIKIDLRVSDLYLGKVFYKVFDVGILGCQKKPFGDECLMSCFCKVAFSFLIKLLLPGI